MVVCLQVYIMVNLGAVRLSFNVQTELGFALVPAKYALTNTF
jgi:hypothetical protein